MTDDFFSWVWLMLDNIKEKKRKPTYGRVIKLTDFFWVHSLFSGLVKDIQFFQYHKQLFLEFEFQFLNLYPTALTSGVMVLGNRSYCSWDEELLSLRPRVTVPGHPYLLFVPHWSLASHHDFTTCELFQLFGRHPSWSQYPPHKVKLKTTKKKIHSLWTQTCHLVTE